MSEVETVTLPRKRKTASQWISRAVQSLARNACSPLAGRIPGAVANRMRWMGHVTARLPDGKKLRLLSDGRSGKDRVVRKVAGRDVADYEPETMAVFFALLEHSTHVVDVGAYSGIFALTAAAGSPDRRVYAFEPVPQIAARLKSHTLLNRLDNLTVETCAVGEVDGQTTLFVPATTWSLPTSSSTRAGFFDETVPITVPIVSLDTYMAGRGMPRIDLMKIDTESTEHLVLAGASQVIAKSKPAIICEVLAESDEAKLQRFFRLTDYRYFLITDEGLVEMQAIRGEDRSGHFKNYLFITPDRIHQVSQLIVDPRQRARLAG